MGYLVTGDTMTARFDVMRYSRGRTERGMTERAIGVAELIVLGRSPKML